MTKHKAAMWQKAKLQSGKTQSCNVAKRKVKKAKSAKCGKRQSYDVAKVGKRQSYNVAKVSNLAKGKAAM